MPMGKLPTVTFKYRGPMHWLTVYRGSIDFFRRRKFEVIDQVYKDKVNEFEGVIVAEQIVSPYLKVVYNMEYKSWDMTPSSEPGVFVGKIRALIGVEVKESFPDDFFHKIYKKLIQREIDEDIEGAALVLQGQYVEFLKQTCNMEARKHA
jgi:hypothetical protein